jgi:predicted enzyme related to lactoylglutathione lyase
MTEKTNFPPGDFCWTELSTTDTDAAKRFYTKLFGWAIEERPTGEGQPPYVMLLKDGKEAAALYLNPGVHPHWGSYVNVTSADETAQKAKSLGATLLMEPFDVMDVGRMAVIKDPQGAVVNVWQAKRHIGARVINEPGTMCWNELYTPDVDGARKFYSELFGWTMKVSPGYTEAHTAGGAATAGMMETKGHLEGVPPHWMPYFAVENCDESAKTAEAAGASIHVAPMDIEKVGRFSVMGDPQGAGFAIIQLNPR